MTQLAREHFDTEIANTMDEIAGLLFINQELRKMSRTFSNSEDIDKDAANPHANKVLKATRTIAATLTEALFKKSSARAALLEEARTQGVKKLSTAITSAEYLAAQEKNALDGTGAKGNTIQVLVVERLIALRAAWQGAAR